MSFVNSNFLITIILSHSFLFLMKGNRANHLSVAENKIKFGRRDLVLGQGSHHLVSTTIFDENA